MPLAQYRYQMDLDKDNSWAYDITPFVLLFQGSRGRDFASQLTGRCTAGSGQIQVLNYDFRFSPLRLTGPYGDKLKPGRRIRAQMLVPGYTWTTLWCGYFSKVIPKGGTTPQEATATLECVGPFDRIMRKIRIEMQKGKTTAECVEIVLDAVGWPSGIDYRYIDTTYSRTTLARFWTGDVAAIDALHDLEETEMGFLYEGPLGQVCWEGRGYRPNRSWSGVTYTNDTAGSIRYATIQTEDSSRDIYNIFKADVHTFDVSDPIILWVLAGEAPEIANGASLTLTAKFPTKGTAGNYVAVESWDVVTPILNTQADGLGADKTSDPGITYGTPVKKDTSASLTITNNTGASVFVTFMEWDGVAVVEGDTIEVSAEDEESKDDYGERTYQFQGRYIQWIEEADKAVNTYLGIYKDPNPVVTLSLVANASAAHLYEASIRDISDLIHIHGYDAAIGLGVDEDFFVERVEHQIQKNGVHTMILQCSAKTTHSWDYSGKEYTPEVIPNQEDKVTGVPDDLQPIGFDPGGRVDVGIVAWKYNEDIVEGEIRAKFFASGEPEFVDLRLVSEGGTFVPDGVNNIQRIGAATWAGFNTSFVSASYGRWYYAGKLKNGAGYSVWSDGNNFPTHVTDYVAIESGVASDGGKPADSTVTLEMVGNGVVPHATRPAINGNTILFGLVQIKDGNVGDWYAPDADTGPAETYFDGSGADSVYDKATGTITSPVPVTGVPTQGGMLMMDVRNASVFDHEQTQWGGVLPANISGSVIKVTGYRPMGLPDSGQQYQHIRFKIVKWLSEWTGYGYYGATPGRGVSEMEFWKTNGDKTTKEFTFPIIPLDAATPLTNIIGRVFWENKVCRSECGANSQTPLEDTGNPQGASGLQIITHTQDPTIPVGMMRLAWYRDTLNYDTIYTAGFWLSNDLPAQGPFSMERADHAAYTIETGSGAVVVAENNKVTVTRGGTAIPEHALLVIYTDDASPDNDIDCEYIDSADTTGFTMHTPFHKSGTFSYAVIKRWMDTGTSESENLKYLQFKVPDEIGGNIEAIRWISPLVPLPSGVFYVTGASRNSYGLGTRMTCSSSSYGGMGCIPLNIVMGTPPAVYTEIVGENTTFFIDAVTSFKLMNITGNIYCGKPIVFLIRQPTEGGPCEIDFDTKFRVVEEVGAVSLSIAPGALDYLGMMYFALEDRFDIVAFVHKPT